MKKVSVLKVRKKPLTVEALQWKGNNYREICDFAGMELMINKQDQLLIPTLEGTMKCSLTDYLIKGLKEELYPIKEELFYETYDVIE